MYKEPLYIPKTRREIAPEKTAAPKKTVAPTGKQVLTKRPDESDEAFAKRLRRQAERHRKKALKRQAQPVGENSKRNGGSNIRITKGANPRTLKQ